MKKYKVLIEGVYRTLIEVEAKNASEALIPENINIPKDIQVNINDIEDFIPVEVIDDNRQNMSKKYKLTDETIKISNKTLYRIEALMNFGKVSKGDKGGFIESERNLSQKGLCWIWDDARVFENAHISENANICNNAKVCGNALIYNSAIVQDNALVKGYAQVYDSAIVKDNAIVDDLAMVYGRARVMEKAQVLDGAKIYEYAHIFGKCTIHGSARIFGHSYISGDALVYDDASVYDSAVVQDQVRIFGIAKVGGCAKIYDNTRICDNAQVLENVYIRGDAQIGGHAVIKSNKDYIIFNKWWESGKFITWTRSDDMWYDNGYYGTSADLLNRCIDEFKPEYIRIINYVEEIKDSE